MYAATLHVLLRQHFAPLCVCMHAQTGITGINYLVLRMVNRMTLMAFKFLLRDFH